MFASMDILINFAGLNQLNNTVMITKEEKEAREARIKQETRKMVRRYNKQEIWVPYGCSVRYFNSVVRGTIIKYLKKELQKKKWGELNEYDYSRILDKVNDEIDEYFDWK